VVNNFIIENPNLSDKITDESFRESSASFCNLCFFFFKISSCQNST